MPKTLSKSPCAPAGAGPKVRKSKSTRWRAGVLIGVHLLAAIHFAHWFATGSTMSPLEPSEAMEFSKHSIVNAGLIFFALMILSTLVFGRFACGWACHLVALQDLSRALLLKLGIRPKPLRSRTLLVVPGLAFVYLFLWPVAFRLWVGDSLAYRGSELTKAGFWDTFPGWGVAIFTFVVCGFAIIYFLGSKGFCTYACPYGAIFGVADRFAPGRIRVTDACEGCGHCTITCTSNVQVAQEVRDYGMVIDPGCMKCQDCVSVCPKGALYFGFGKPAAFADPRREPKRRSWPYSRAEEAVLAVTFVLAFFAFRGLHGLVPFLLALGIAGIVAFLTLQLVRLGTKDLVKLYSLTLKQSGRVQPKGWAFAAAVAAILGLGAYGATRQFPAARADLAGVFVQAGHQARVTGDSDLAVERYERALRVQPATTAAVMALVQLHAEEERIDAARTVLERGLAHLPDDAGLHHDYGVLLTASGDPTAAKDEFQRAIALDPRHFEANSKLAQILMSTGFEDEALAVLERWSAAAPESADPHAVLAQAHMVLARTDLAATHARRATDLAPERADLWVLLAQALDAQGDNGGAENAYQEAKRLEPRLGPR